ncbi:MAG TPA: preprotein translocase subunit SecG [Planctomycetes bacterium]|nr:preprotein translocase subunit SecG [Planctomycetota bacterium]
MTVFPLLAVSFIMKVVAVLFMICAVALILIILVQKGRGGGLSAALGGGIAGGILGSKTGDFLTWVTIVLVGIFLTLAVVMAKFYKPSISDFGEGAPPAATVPTEPPPTVPTEPPRGPELPSPIEEVETTTDSESSDANSSDIR